jgi:phenylacetate-coenzyme A ligase PaaK-like adenylate-forming protein
MPPIVNLADIPPYTLDRDAKAALHTRALADLTTHHYRGCDSYRRVLDAIGAGDGSKIRTLADVPFIPVRMFKDFELLSVPRDQVVKTMTSSGTSGQSVSKIFLDRDTSANQTKVLAKLVGSFIGTKRVPMLVIDSRTVISDRNLLSARGAGILGFSMFGSEVEYALDERMNLDLPRVQAFAEKHAGESMLAFGFTFMIWQHFHAALKASGVKLPLDGATVIHGGGWKKLVELQVDNAAFKKGLRDVAGVSRVFSYYGMVEQTGSIYVECEAGHLHTSGFSDVLVRDHRDFSVVPNGEEGLVQLLSLLPTSYPGHSILSEDRGRILGEDDCTCGRKGRYFEILGRIKDAEVRGCSDVYASAA